MKMKHLDFECFPSGMNEKILGVGDNHQEENKGQLTSVSIEYYTEESTD